ncbi:MAG: hypothetical protein GY751_24450 [Bacteroidetes bacterium]|nr:hypothetical protein [Bacteroidota bacterium]
MKRLFIGLRILLVPLMLSCNTESFIEESPDSYAPQLIEDEILKGAGYLVHLNLNWILR